MIGFIMDSAYFTRNQYGITVSPEFSKILAKGGAPGGDLYYPIRVSRDSIDNNEIVKLIADLKEEHRDLDQAIARMVEVPSMDQLRLTRLKKRKLKLKDWIAYLESRLIPDLDA
jgi:hypothetical protein